MIKEFCTYIANNTSFTLGTTLFAIAVESDDIDTCIVVAEPNPGLVNGILVDYRQIPLVIYSRATTKFIARNNAYTVFDLLQSPTGKIQVTLPVVGSGYTYVCNFDCRTPGYTGLDESGRRYVYSMPVDVTVTNMSE